MASSNDSELLDSGHFVYTIHSVIPLESKDSFESLQRRMNEKALKFEGYRGQSISFQETEDGRFLATTTRIVFEALDQCLCWLDSPERRTLLYQAEMSMNYRYRASLEGGSFDQWIQKKLDRKIPVWKVNLLVWLALYPSVMLLIVVGNSTIGTLPLPLNMLISNFITVLLTGHFLVPWLSRLYEGWLQTRSIRFTWLGIASVVIAQLFLFHLFSRLPGMPWEISSLKPFENVLNVVL